MEYSDSDRERAMQIIEEQTDFVMKIAMFNRWKHTRSIESMLSIDITIPPENLTAEERVKQVLSKQYKMSQEEAVLQARTMLGRMEDFNQMLDSKQSSACEPHSDSKASSSSRPSEASILKDMLENNPLA